MGSTSGLVTFVRGPDAIELPARRAWLAVALAFFVLVAGAGVALAHGPEGHHGKGAASTPAAEAPAEGVEASGSTMVTGEEADPTAPAQAAHPAHVEPAGELGDVLRALHPATVHFPIAFFLFAGLLEILALARKRPAWFATVDILMLAGAIGAILAALFGWIHTGFWLGGDLAMQWHRWTGTGIALAGLVALVALRRESRALVRAVLAVICVALLLQGFWGGELAHGPNHLAWY